MAEGDGLNTPRQRFIATLNRQPLIGRVPHFELVFFLTMEAFGKVHPSHRHYEQWQQMEIKERRLHLEDMASVYIATAERFEHSAIYLHPNPESLEETLELIDVVREKSGNKYFLLLPGDVTFSIPDGQNMESFSYRLIDDLQGLKREAEQKVNRAIEHACRIAEHGGMDGFALCAD